MVVCGVFVVLLVASVLASMRWLLCGGDGSKKSKPTFSKKCPAREFISITVLIFSQRRTENSQMCPNYPHRSGQRHQRICKRPGARHGEQTRPPSTPRQCSRVEHGVWSIASLGNCQAFDELEGLFAPSSSRLKGDHNKATSVTPQELNVLPLFLLPRS